MKKHFLIVLLIFSSILVYSQNPIDYSFVVRDASGKLLDNKYIIVKIGLKSNSPSGNKVYTETHTANTNSYGMLSLKIGRGIPVSGNYSKVNLNNSDYFAEIEIDARDGRGYKNIGVFQISKQGTNQVSFEGNNIIPIYYQKEISRLKAYEGMIVYNKNSKSINFYNGTTWRELADKNANVKENKYVTTNVTNNKAIAEHRDIKLTGQPGTALQYAKNRMFYSARDNKSFTAGEADANSRNIDIAFLWQRDKGYVFCSPDAPYITDIFGYNGYNYNPSNKKHTKIQRIEYPYENIDSPYLDGLHIRGERLPTGNGIGVTNLKPGDVVAFETQEGKKGIIKIKPGDRALFSITFDVKVK